MSLQIYNSPIVRSDIYAFNYLRIYIHTYTPYVPNRYQLPNRYQPRLLFWLGEVAGCEKETARLCRHCLARQDTTWYGDPCSLVLFGQERPGGMRVLGKMGPFIFF